MRYGAEVGTAEGPGGSGLFGVGEQKPNNAKTPQQCDAVNRFMPGFRGGGGRPKQSMRTGGAAASLEGAVRSNRGRSGGMRRAWRRAGRRAARGGAWCTWT